MIGELLCPDCGGVVGATETTEAGPPCKCFVAEPSSTSETVSDLPPPVDAPVAKVCRICGKDVTGQKRVRDHLGYYCYECAKEVEKKEHQGRVRCKVCGHLTKEENIQPYDGVKMCRRCRQDRDELKIQKIKRMGFKGARTREELRRIYMMAAALVVLLVFMAYGAMKLVHGR
jgi:DNA-directed RNA polymerase subunit RPC12/RpoP